MKKKRLFLRKRKDEINAMFTHGRNIDFIASQLQRKYSIGLKNPHPESIPPSVNPDEGWIKATDDYGNTLHYYREDPQEVVVPGNFSVMKRRNNLNRNGYQKFIKFIEEREYETPIEVILKKEFQQGIFEKNMPKEFSVYLKKTDKGQELLEEKLDLQKKIKGESVPLLYESRTDRLGAFAGIASKWQQRTSMKNNY